LSDGIEATKIAERDFDRELRRFARTALIEAERPQRKLFEPEGRVFASAAQQDLERSGNALSREEFLSTVWSNIPR
jgi:hypothetical protein